MQVTFVRRPFGTGRERTLEGHDRGKVNWKAAFGTRTPIAKESSIADEIALYFERFGEWKSRWSSTGGPDISIVPARGSGLR